ncbi:MAG: S-methyl-5'-thioinosine phosphorylase [Woeseiaceae bacterium]
MKQSMRKKFAIIVGSGFDGFVGAEDGVLASTPFGEPSSPIRDLTIGDDVLRVLSRHGDSHAIPPHLINYRANLVALKNLDVGAVIALNTVGVISAVRRPGELAVPDQIIDYTWGREHSIQGAADSGVLHVDFTEPFTRVLRDRLLSAAAAAGIDCHDGGVCAVMQGPRLETAAEIDRLERDGADFIGMTGMPEASIALELGLDYACLALIVNNAAGRGQKSIHEDVETSTLSARKQAIDLLQQFFAYGDNSNR